MEGREPINHSPFQGFFMGYGSFAIFKNVRLPSYKLVSEPRPFVCFHSDSCLHVEVDTWLIKKNTLCVQLKQDYLLLFISFSTAANMAM